MSQRILAPKTRITSLAPAIPPVRIRTVVIEIDGQRQAFMTVGEAFSFLARTYSAEIKTLRELESLETLPELPSCGEEVAS